MACIFACLAVFEDVFCTFNRSTNNMILQLCSIIFQGNGEPSAIGAVSEND